MKNINNKKGKFLYKTMYSIFYLLPYIFLFSLIDYLMEYLMLISKVLLRIKFNITIRPCVYFYTSHSNTSYPNKQQKKGQRAKEFKTNLKKADHSSRNLRNNKKNRLGIGPLGSIIVTIASRISIPWQGGHVSRASFCP